MPHTVVETPHSQDTVISSILVVQTVVVVLVIKNVNGSVQQQHHFTAKHRTPVLQHKVIVEN